MSRLPSRAIARCACALVLSLLTASPAFAQRKKPPRKATPAATAKPAPAPAPESPPSESETAPLPPPESTPPAVEPDRAPPRPRKVQINVPLLDASLGLDWFQRHLSYSGDTQNALPPYDLSGAPALALRVGVFPLRTGEWSFGAVGTLGYGFALNSNFKSPADGQVGSYTTKSSQYGIGLRGRYHFGATGSVGVGFDYGAQNYSIDLPPPTLTNASVPDVSYSFLRPSVEARIDVFRSFAVLASAGYLIVMDAGEITSDTYFVKSRSSVTGFDLGIAVSYAVLPQLELRPGFDFRHYGFSFNHQPGDLRVASSASDSFVSFGLSVAYLM